MVVIYGRAVLSPPLTVYKIDCALPSATLGVDVGLPIHPIAPDFVPVAGIATLGEIPGPEDVEHDFDPVRPETCFDGVDLHLFGEPHRCREPRLIAALAVINDGKAVDSTRAVPEAW